MKSTLFSLVLFFVISSVVRADYVPSSSKAPEPAREFRGAWVATVHNIDWPSRKGLSASQQKSEMIKILDSAAQVGINAIILQVRTESDALYNSKYEPWSAWLTGTQGKNPGYDPLAFAIAEAHKRGIELHAWFNPFRASSSDANSKASNHITKTHQGSMMRAATQTYGNPAHDYIRQRAINVITDVVRRYDVDGVHMDDYFYPYPKINGSQVIEQFNDSRDYQAYRNTGGRLSVKDWRRANIDGFINQLYLSIKNTKRHVKFGISPFGIWRPGVPSSIKANIDAYDHLAADSRKWLNNGWVDYMTPQLYWRIDDRDHSFTTLAKWWAGENKQDRHLWPGVASSRILSKEDRSRPASESIRQINVARQVTANPMGSGHVHWSFKALKDDKGGIRKQLGSAYSLTPIIPASPWLDNRAPANLWIVPREDANSVTLYFRESPGARWHLVQTRATASSPWRTMRMIPASQKAYRIPNKPFEIAVRNISACGILSNQTVVQRSN